MIRRLRQMRISLAAKCQLLFGAAVILIIGASLYIPWKRMEGLTRGVDLDTSEGLAHQALLEHVVTKMQPGKQAAPVVMPTTMPVGMPIYIWPRLIGVDAPRREKLTRFDLAALKRFADHPADLHFDEQYRLHGQLRYRMAMPEYDEPSCISCHALSPAGAIPIPTTVPTALSPPPRLLGIVVVDIPSQMKQSELLLNRMYILFAGVIAGSLALGVLTLIITGLILRPVRVLQETAERVSKGDLSIRAHIASGDEFEQLSQTVNTMLANLKKGDEQLRSINKALDLKLGQLAQTNVALFESNRLKSEFLANVSHELRTPLNSILGFAELLRETVAENPDAKPIRYLQNILGAGRNLLDLINDLLDLAKIEAGRMEVRSDPLSLGDVFEGLTNLLKPLSEEKKLTISSTVGADVPIIQTDSAKLQQVLYNFLANAIKFSPAEASVELAAQTQGAEQVRISVTDHGPGIDPEKHAMIFEKFRQIDGSVTREHSGSGLGLAISKELTSLLGGTIGVDSTAGAGATFWIILPLRIQPGQRDVRSKLVLS